MSYDTFAYSLTTGDEALERVALTGKIKMVIDCAELAGLDLSNRLLEGVTNGVSYDILNAWDRMPCAREVYYAMYRKFFYLLSAVRN